jgi:hypothetical protein
MEQSARVSEGGLQLRRSCGCTPDDARWQAMCLLPPAGPHPRRKSPCDRSYVAFPRTWIPARPRRYAVDGRWPCAPNPGRWTNQRAAPPTSFPATLTWRRWRLTLPDAHRTIPPPARVPPIGSCGDGIALAANCRCGSWASYRASPPRPEWPRGRIAGAAPRPLALRTPTVYPRSRHTRVRERCQPTTCPWWVPPQVYGRRLGGSSELVAPSPHSFPRAVPLRLPLKTGRPQN